MRIRRCSVPMRALAALGSLMFVLVACKTTHQGPPGSAATTDPVVEPRSGSVSSEGGGATDKRARGVAAGASAGNDHDPVMARYAGREIRASELGQWFLKTYRREALAAMSKLIGLEIVEHEASKIGLACPPGHLALHAKDTLARLEREAALTYGLGTSADRYVRLKFQQSLEDHLSLQREQERQRWLFGRVIRFDAMRTDRVQLAMIVTRDKKVAEDVAERLDQGADFGRLAARHSIHESRSRGGKLPPLPREALSAAVASRAFEMREGTRTGILEVDDGRGHRQFEIVRLVKRMPGRDVRWGDVRTGIEADLKVRPIDPMEWTARYLRLERLYKVQVTGNL